MANTHKFQVKNGLTSPNIEFKDSNLGATITATMSDSTDTLSFQGDAGQLFSITDSLGGTLFTVSDISGIPSLEIDDQGIVRISEFNGYLVVGGDSETDTKGVTIKSGAIQIRTDSAPGYIDFYCEVNNQHRVRLKSPLHANYGGNPEVVLPNVTGTLLTDSSTATLLNKTIDANGTGNNISNIDIGNMTAAVIVTEAEGIGSNDNDTTLPTSAAVKDYVDNNAGGGGGVTVQDEGSALSTTGTTLNFVGAGVVASGTGATKTITIAGSAGGGVDVQDEGSTLSTTATALDFVGAGVTASGTGATKTITITGASGGITTGKAIAMAMVFG